VGVCGVRAMAKGMSFGENHDQKRSEIRVQNALPVEDGPVLSRGLSGGAARHPPPISLRSVFIVDSDDAVVLAITHRRRHPSAWQKRA